MEWYIAHLNSISTIVGLLFDIAGAWLVAWEVVQQYNGNKYLLKNIPDRHFRSSLRPSAEDHPDFKGFEERKYRKMKWGLGFLTIGFLLQMFPSLVELLS